MGNTGAYWVNSGIEDTTLSDTSLSGAEEKPKRWLGEELTGWRSGRSGEFGEGGKRSQQETKRGRTKKEALGKAGWRS